MIFWFGVWLCLAAAAAPFAVLALGGPALLMALTPAVMLAVGMALMTFGEWLEWG